MLASRFLRVGTTKSPPPPKQNNNKKSSPPPPSGVPLSWHVLSCPFTMRASGSECHSLGLGLGLGLGMPVQPSYSSATVHPPLLTFSVPTYTGSPLARHMSMCSCPTVKPPSGNVVGRFFWTWSGQQESTPAGANIGEHSLNGPAQAERACFRPC